MKNLPMDLLRTFTTIADLGGFTQAGDVLGRSQPAISLQVKRLEEMLGTQLFNRANAMATTEEGQVLYGYARKILELNDAAVARLTTPSVSGAVRLGLPNDFEVSFLPTTLSKFATAYPDITLDVQTDLSSTLREDFTKGGYDLVMSMDEYPTDNFHDDDCIVEPLSWVCGPGFELPVNQPVPLVLYPKGCIYRHHIIQALNKAHIPWRVLYSTSSLLGLLSAIEAGLGVSALAINTAPSTLSAHGKALNLPHLGQVTIGFNYDHNNQDPATALLLDHLKRGLLDAHQNQGFNP